MGSYENILSTSVFSWNQHFSKKQDFKKPVFFLQQYSILKKAAEAVTEKSVLFIFTCFFPKIFILKIKTIIINTIEHFTVYQVPSHTLSRA